jgi:hypothetical protein
MGLVVENAAAGKDSVVTAGAGSERVSLEIVADGSDGALVFLTALG